MISRSSSARPPSSHQATLISLAHLSTEISFLLPVAHYMRRGASVHRSNDSGLSRTQLQGRPYFCLKAFFQAVVRSVDIQDHPATMGYHVSFGESLVSTLWKAGPFVKGCRSDQPYVFHHVGVFERYFCILKQFSFHSLHGTFTRFQGYVGCRSTPYYRAARVAHESEYSRVVWIHEPRLYKYIGVYIYIYKSRSLNKFKSKGSRGEWIGNGLLRPARTIHLIYVHLSSA